MYTRNRNIHWQYKASVALLYILFLAVQVFFNFDIGRKYFYTGSNVFIVNYQATHTAKTAVKASASLPSKSKLRLNKRFEPPVAPEILAVSAPVMSCYVVLKTIGCYVSRNYSSQSSPVHSRRGPPAVIA